MPDYLSELERLYQDMTTSHDYESSNYTPVKEFVQAHGAHLAGPVEAPSNPTFSYEARQAESPDQYFLAFGVIETVFPHFGSGVATIAGHGVMQIKFSISDTGFSTDISDIPSNGSAGIFAVEPGSSVATLLSLTSPISVDNTSDFSDYIVQGSGVGAYISPQHNLYINALDDSGGAIPFTGDRAYDAIAGDYTCFNISGIGLHLDTELAYLRSSEICGVFIFRESGTLRIAGESLEIEGESYSRQSGEFNRELSDVEQRFIYPWEVLGSLDVDASLSVVKNGPDSLFDGVYASYEPEDENIAPIARMDVLGGYLGQGWQEIVSVPTPELAPRGVMRSQTLLDGTFMLETAAGAIFAKTHDVPVIRRQEHPEVLLEDESYRFSGQIPDGESPAEHKVRSLIGDAISADDYYAYVSRWQSTLAGHYHPHVEVSLNGQELETIAPTWDESNRVATPEENLKVDDRYGEMTIKQLLSLFALMPNGDVVLKNSHGAELRLSGGDVLVGGAGFTVDCARNVALFADRISLRGYSDVEAAASQGSVRIKAEQNVLVLGGNSGDGGVLIESRGSGLASDWTRDPKTAVASGVVIKSANSHVSLFGGQILCKTGGSGNGLSQGNIILDCDVNRVMLLGANLQRHTSGELRDYFKTGAGGFLTVNTYSSTQTVVSGALKVPGDVVIGRELQVTGNIRSSKGHIYTRLAPQFDFKVKLERNPAQIDANVQLMQEEKILKIEQEITEFSRLQQEYASRDRPLNSRTITKASFGFPASEGYGTEGSKFRRAEWQATFSGDTTWDEPVVKYQGRDDTRPYPGNATWESPETLLIPSESVLINPQTGQPKVIIEGDLDSRKVYEDFSEVQPKYGTFVSDFKREKQ